MKNGSLGVWCFALRRIDWQAIGTLTFAGRVPSESVFRRRLADWLRWVAVGVVSCGASRNFLWFVRPEEGEQFGRPHCHIMLAGLPSQVVENYIVASGLVARGIPSACTQLAHKCGFGFCGFRWLTANDAGLQYLTWDAGDEYEWKKSTFCKQPIFSPSLWRKLLTATKGKGFHVDVEQSDQRNHLQAGTFETGFRYLETITRQPVVCSSLGPVVQ